MATSRWSAARLPADAALIGKGLANKRGARQARDARTFVARPWCKEIRAAESSLPGGTTGVTFGFRVARGEVAMSKNVVFFADGTGNDRAHGVKTNVAKLCDLAINIDRKSTRLN